MTLHSLKKFTTYQIIVQAYNKEGVGPASNTLVATTMEDGEDFTLFRRNRPRITAFHWLRILALAKVPMSCLKLIYLLPLTILRTVLMSGAMVYFES